MNQIDYENLGTRMKELRIKMKLTQAEVARALNVTPGYISNVENNRTAMSLRILIYYARLLNISLDSLIGRIDSEYRETALDREISEQVHKLEIPQKQKLLWSLLFYLSHFPSDFLPPRFLFRPVRQNLPARISLLHDQSVLPFPKSA